MHSSSRSLPVALALIACLGGCSSTVRNAAAAPASSAVGSSAPSRPCRSAAPAAGSGDADGSLPGHPAADQVAALGHPLTLKGDDPGEQVTVTFLQVVDPACGVGGPSLLDRGMKYVGLRLRLLDSGRKPYSDSPSNCSWGRTDTGLQVGSFVYPTLAEGPAVAPRGNLVLKPGQSATSYVVMEIPQHAHMARIDFTMDSGFADETGEWTLG
ncbi:hypothetical protein ACEZCY_05400 [Streptacidiphilus sp. N1-12]|uniref:DUF4352 domain-containing protein n=2 Tax=Streptacidiphilus alkalitolerans TaxID=3342712 RepID=A0ABV6V4R6_9ACTN